MIVVSLHFRCPWCQTKCQVLVKLQADETIVQHLDVDSYRVCEHCKRQFPDGKETIYALS